MPVTQIQTINSCCHNGSLFLTIFFSIWKDVCLNHEIWKHILDFFVCKVSKYVDSNTVYFCTVLYWLFLIPSVLQVFFHILFHGSNSSHLHVMKCCQLFPSLKRMVLEQGCFLHCCLLNKKGARSFLMNRIRQWVR